jgi:FtsZ-binding cell division protein ZapB
MAVNAAEFEELKAKVGRLQTKSDQAAGAFKERMEELKKAHGCDSLKEAKAKLDAFEAEATAAEEEYEAEKKKFETEWRDALASVPGTRR